jgi:hypothetical protein
VCRLGLRPPAVLLRETIDRLLRGLTLGSPLVGDRKWEESMLAFAGHPVTTKDVRFFETRQSDQARTGLSP